jgi:hypothetical protein
VGFSLYAQFVNGSRPEVGEATLAQALRLFEEFPWDDEARQLAASQTADMDAWPELGMLDDSGRELRIRCDETGLAGIAYNFPTLPSAVLREETPGYIATDNFPRSEVGELIKLFFASEEQLLLERMKKHTAQEEPTR